MGALTYTIKMLLCVLLHALVGEKGRNEENITQIMWPSHYIRGLREGPIHQRLHVLARALLGEDMAFDFDMMISKV